MARAGARRPAGALRRSARSEPIIPTGQPETLSGRVERVTYANEENGYTVLAVKIPGRKNAVTAVGQMPCPQPGEFIQMEGLFVLNPDYGPQFKVSSCTLSPPATEEALKKYLGSGLVKGVGPVLAGRLVDHFGRRTLDILDSEPQRLTEVPGLGAGRREKIIEAWRKAAGLKRLLAFLAEFGLGPAAALRIMRQLGSQAAELIRQDPYRLAYEVKGVGFVTADRVARTLGLSESSPQRLEAALMYSLSKAGEEGDVFLPQGRLLSLAGELAPQAGERELTEALGRLVLEGRVKAQLPPEPGEPDIYQPRLKRAEDWVASDLMAIARTRARLEVPRRDKALAWAMESLGLELSASQLTAARLALEEKVLVITGGPGTGKTTITRVITAIYGALRASIALVAPTGRAAKRLSEATGLKAQTVHRLLEYNPQAGGFVRGPNNKLEVDLLLLDEASMVDIVLMNQLTAALPPQARLIVVGDCDQLPSVGPGRVLEDLMNSGLAAVARLKEIHRQAAESQIVRAAHQINQGLVPDSSPERDRGDFYFIESRDPARILEQIAYLVCRKLPEKLSLTPADIQVLTPMHNRELGTEALNQLLSEKLNPGGGPALNRFGRRLRAGDRVMQLRNDYNREVFNGDHGLVEKVDLEAQELSVNFDGRSVLYDFSETDDLTLAYAITIHKAQGSEFPAVIVPIASSHHIMLRRQLLYTAVTRGRRFVVLIGSPEALKRAVADNRQQSRHSRLALKLAGQLPL